MSPEKIAILKSLQDRESVLTEKIAELLKLKAELLETREAIKILRKRQVPPLIRAFNQKLKALTFS